MCDPISAGLAIVAAATQAVSVVSQNQAASANNRAVEQQLGVRKKEIDQAATAEMNARLREARREQSRILVASGEAGLSLTSGGIESLLLDSVQQAELSNDASLANRESRKAAADAEAQSKVQAKTTVLGAGLQIGLAAGGSALNSVAAQRRQRPS